MNLDNSNILIEFGLEFAKYKITMIIKTIEMVEAEMVADMEKRKHDDIELLEVLQVACNLNLTNFWRGADGQLLF